MGQTYAGILGVLAFVAVLGRGLIQAGHPSSMLASACLAMITFAAIGLVIGQIGMLVIRDSVRLTFRDRLASARDGEDADQTATLD